MSISTKDITMTAESNKRPFFLIIDGSSMLSTHYYGLLPAEIKFKKTEEERIPLYHKLLHAKDGTYTNAVYGMCNALVQLLQDTHPQYLAVVFDKTRNTFRRTLYPDYKGQRSETPAPLKEQFGLIQKLLNESGIMTIASDTYEADDIAGTLAEYYKRDARIRLLTKDRDYLQLVDDAHDVRCWIFADREKSTEFRKKYSGCYGAANIEYPNSLVNIMEFTEQSVFGEKGVLPKFIPDLKGIEGDVSDNIPGVKGVSSAAAPLLMEYNGLESLYAEIETILGKDDEKELIAFWKELGIKRSPLNALRTYRDSAFLSKELATIKTDVPISPMIDDFSLEWINKTIFNDWMKKLDIKNVHMN